MERFSKTKTQEARLQSFASLTLEKRERYAREEASLATARRDFSTNYQYLQDESAMN